MAQWRLKEGEKEKDESRNQKSVVINVQVKWRKGEGKGVCNSSITVGKLRHVGELGEYEDLKVSEEERALIFFCQVIVANFAPFLGKISLFAFVSVFLSLSNQLLQSYAVVK